MNVMDPAAISCEVEKYGVRLRWTELHMTKSELEALRLRSGDAPDDVPPPWVDFAKIAAGQNVFRKFVPLIALTLFYRSLVGGFSAAVIVQTLRRAGGLFGKDAWHRVVRTAKFVVIASTQDLKQGGDGWKATVRIRRIHERIHGQIDGAVNVEDLMGTLLAFSISVLQGIEKCGATITEDEKNAYLHLWRYLGYLLGVPEDVNPLTSEAKARAVFESIFLHIFEPDVDSILLAHHLLKAVPFGFFEHRAAWCRFFIGNPLADALKLPKPSIFNMLRVIMETSFLRCYATLIRVPLLHRIILHFHDVAIDTFLQVTY